MHKKRQPTASKASEAEALAPAPVVKKRGKREERADETRRALFSAAAVVVGKHGYEEASITRITEEAGVGSGTFYNYFKSRQDLFDQLLPAVGGQLLEYIASQLDPALKGIDRERARIVAYFEFFQKHTGFLRILNEAEVYAPNAFKQHVQNFAVRYARALDRQRENGELGKFSKDELTAIVYMLMGARSYLTMLWRSAPDEKGKSADQSYISTYLKLLEHGLFSRESNHSEVARSRKLAGVRSLR